jgi:hypothetical protein
MDNWKREELVCPEAVYDGEEVTIQAGLILLCYLELLPGLKRMTNR